MGNSCVLGGARVSCDALVERGNSASAVDASAIDNEDGSYTLQWRSQKSGTFTVAVKIADTHVVGSPHVIKFVSTQPELAKSVLSGEGLENAVAGKRNRFELRFYDQFSNAAVPSANFRLGLALLKNGEKNKEARVHDDFEMKVLDADDGLYEVSYTAKKDGNFDLHVWADELPKGVSTTASARPLELVEQKGKSSALDDGTRKADRAPFPDSPFHCVVVAGAASPHKSFVEGWTKESRAVDKHGKAVVQDTNNIVAGDAVVLRPQICDALGNAAVLPEGALGVSIVYPNGTSVDMGSSTHIKFSMQSKGGATTYDIRHEATHAGTHSVHITLDGVPIQGSPVCFEVQESVAEVKMCELTPPRESPLYSSQTYTILLKTFDRFGNPMSHGGLPVSTRLQLIKSGVHDLTTLMPNNHTVEVDDLGNGTYRVNVGLIKICATVKVIVNMDKNIPAAGGELPPVQLTFVPQPGAEATMAEEDAVLEAVEDMGAAEGSVGVARLRDAGGEIMSMLAVGAAGARPKATFAVAAEGFQEIGKNRRASTNS